MASELINKGRLLTKNDVNIVGLAGILQSFAENASLQNKNCL